MLVACVACTHEHARSLRWRSRVLKHRARVRVSFDSRRWLWGHFAVRCEGHQFDTCRVADIKARPRAGCRDSFSWGLVTKIERLRAIYIGGSSARGNRAYQCGIPFARKRYLIRLCRARWFFNITGLIRYLIFWLNAELRLQNMKVVRKGWQSRSVCRSLYTRNHRSQWDCVYIHARAPLTITIVAIFAICVSYRGLKRSFRFYRCAFCHYLRCINWRLIFSVCPDNAGILSPRTSGMSVSLCSRHHSYLPNYRRGISFMLYPHTHFVPWVFQVH